MSPPCILKQEEGSERLNHLICCRKIHWWIQPRCVWLTLKPGLSPFLLIIYSPLRLSSKCWRKYFAYWKMINNCRIVTIQYLMHLTVIHTLIWGYGQLWPLPRVCVPNPVSPVDQLIQAFVESKSTAVSELAVVTVRYMKWWDICKLSFTQWRAMWLMSMLCIINKEDQKEMGLFELEKGKSGGRHSDWRVWVFWRTNGLEVARSQNFDNSNRKGQEIPLKSPIPGCFHTESEKPSIASVI